MKNRIVVMVIFFITVVSIGPAVAADLPKVLKDGFDQYLKEGPRG